MRTRAAAVLLAAGLPLCAASRLLVTVVEQKSGVPVTDLKAADFSVTDDKTPRRVEASEFVRDTLDIMLLVDTSLAGPMVQPMAETLIQRLEPKEQVALVAFHSSADLIQDFTSSRELLLRALSKVKYGNEPHVLDALYAAIDGGFQNSAFRRVILLLTAGVEGASRTGERDVIRLARRNQVSIYPVYVMGHERSLLETLARQTGGASFRAGDLRKGAADGAAAHVLDAVRAHYVLSIAGNLGLGEKARIEVKGARKLLVSALPLD